MNVPLPQICEEIYENQRIVLDGICWVACSFKNCELVINSGVCKLKFCTFPGCKLVLEGNAATVAQQDQLLQQILALIQALLRIEEDPAVAARLIQLIDPGFQINQNKKER